MAGVDLAGYGRFISELLDLSDVHGEVSESPIYCLGTVYPANDQGTPSSTDKDEQNVDKRSNTSASHETSPADLKGVALEEDRKVAKGSPPAQVKDRLQAFRDDVESRIWMTYRSNFEPIPRAAEANMTVAVRLRNLTERQGFTSDTGWGCLIRSGQCVLANAILILQLGREWRRKKEPSKEVQLLSFFADTPSAPFSIHRFVNHGANACGKYPGEWFGPSATARCIQALVQDQKEIDLRVYINCDGADVYVDKFIDIAKSNTATFTPVLILLGTRLGIDNVNPAYGNALKFCLASPQSTGIAGGRPSSSHYFFAYQEDAFFYLDPHFTRTALPFHSNPEDYSQAEVDSCHTSKLRRLSLSDMDPSMLLSFLIRDETEWNRWCSSMSSFQGKKIVHIADKEPLMSNEAERASAVDEVETFDEDIAEEQ